MSDDPPPEDWTHFEGDYFAFDEHWRDWIDNPPVGWRPPKDKPLFWKVFGRIKQDGWTVRIDAWIDAQGIHIHFRWVVVVAIPDQAEHELWIASDQDPEYQPTRYFHIAKRGVAGIVVNWFEMVMMEHQITDDLDPSTNGKGEDLDKHDRKEL